MIDLDELERRLEDAKAKATEESNRVREPGDDFGAYGLEQALEILREMRAAALPAADANSLPVMHAGETTQAMRRAALPRSGSLRATMVQLLLNHGHTDDELERTLARSHQTVSAARHGLVQQGWVQAMTHHGEPVQRPTRAGNAAQVWTLTPAARLRLSIDRARAS